MEQSSLSSGIQRIEHEISGLQQIKHRIDDAAAGAEGMPSEFQRLHLELQHIERRIGEIAAIAKGTASDLQGLQLCFTSLQSEMKNQSVHMDLLRLSQDGVRFDHRDSVTAVREQINDNSANQFAKLDQLTVLSAENLKILTSLSSQSSRFAIPLGRDVLMRTLHGYLVVPSEDFVLMAAVWEANGSLEPGTIKVMKALIREGDHVIDVRANIGLTILPAARAVGPTGRVFAFESATRAVEVLRRTLALNFLSDRVVLHPFAAGAMGGTALGTAHLSVGQIPGHSSLLGLPNAASEVEVCTVDSCVPAGDLVRLAKLDAEGFEPQVWRGMQRVIAENPKLAVIVKYGPEHLRRAEIGVSGWLEELLAPGFTAYEIDEASGNLRAVRDRQALLDVTSLNLLLLRQQPAEHPELRFE